MEDKEQKIKISFETNAEDTGKKIEGVNQTLDNNAKETQKVEQAQRGAGSSTKELGKNIAGLDTPINATIGGMKMMLKQMWLIVANPIGAILAAIVLVFVGLVAIFRTFTPLVDKLEQAMAALGAVFNVVKNAFISVFTGTKSLSEAFSGMGDDIADAAKRTMDLVKAQQDLEDVLKSQEVTTAKNRAAINKLNVELRNRTKTEEERLKIADEIVKRENEDFQQRKKLVDEEVRLAREAIAIKAQFTKEEIKLLKETGDATKELAESRGGNYDEEFDALNKARLKAIALEDEATTNIEKAYNRRDKLEDERTAKLEKAAADAKARQEKFEAAQKAQREKEEAAAKAEQQKQFEAAMAGADAGREFLRKRAEDNQKFRDEEAAAEEKALNDSIKKAVDKAREEKAIEDALLRQKEEIQQKTFDVANQGVSLLASVFGKSKKIQKAAMIAEGAISIGKQIAANNAANLGALATPQAIATSGASAVPVIALNNISTGIGVASTIASTAKALKSLGGGGGGLNADSSSRSGGAGATGAAPQVAFQASSENQIANATASNLSTQPIEAFIVESSVSSAQQLANNRITSNSL